MRDAEECVLDARSLRVSVADDDRAFYAKQVGTTVVLGVHSVPHLQQPLTKDACGEPAQNVACNRGADHGEDLTRNTLGRLEDDIAREAVRHEHVGRPAPDVSTLDVTDETDPRLLHEPVRLLGEVVALPWLLADVDESHPRFPV